MLRMVLLAVLWVLRKTMCDFGRQVVSELALLMKLSSVEVLAGLLFLGLIKVSSVVSPAAALFLCFSDRNFWEGTLPSFVSEPESLVRKILSDDSARPAFSGWRFKLLPVGSDLTSCWTWRENSASSSPGMTVGNSCCLLTVNLRSGSLVGRSLLEEIRVSDKSHRMFLQEHIYDNCRTTLRSMIGWESDVWRPVSVSPSPVLGNTSIKQQGAGRAPPMGSDVVRGSYNNSFKVTAI